MKHEARDRSIANPFKLPRFFFASVTLFGLWSAPAWSAVVEPLKVAKSGWESEAVRHVATAKVVLANYALIKKDFSQFKDLPESEHHKIDEWLLAKTAYVSVAQAGQSVVNSPIVTDGEGRARRPEAYNRALIFELDGGLMDVKGVGSRYPHQGHHSNGLTTLGEAIREFLYEKLVSEIFQRENVGIETVGNYAVIDFGFDVLDENGTKTRAGAVLRQAEDRAVLGQKTNFFLDAPIAKFIESVLRKYGVTSAGDRWNKEPYDAVNMQATLSGSLVDFGSYMTVSHFTREVMSYEGEDIIFRTTDPDFPKVDDDVRVPVKDWGSTASGLEDPQYDNPWIYATNTAEAIRLGHANRGAVDNLVNDLFRDLHERWARHPQEPESDHYRQYMVGLFGSNPMFCAHNSNMCLKIIKSVIAKGEIEEIEALITAAPAMNRAWTAEKIDDEMVKPLIRAYMQRYGSRSFLAFAAREITASPRKNRIAEHIIQELVSRKLLGGAAEDFKKLLTFTQEMSVFWKKKFLTDTYVPALLDGLATVLSPEDDRKVMLQLFLESSERSPLRNAIHKPLVKSAIAADDLSVIEKLIAQAQKPESSWTGPHVIDPYLAELKIAKQNHVHNPAVRQTKKNCDSLFY